MIQRSEIKNVLTKNMKLSKIMNYLKSEGLIFKEKRLFKKAEEQQLEIIHETIEDFLKNKHDELVLTIKEKRKVGHDMFIHELRKRMLASKLKVALATKTHKDIEHFMKKFKKLEAEVGKIV